MRSKTNLAIFICLVILGVASICNFIFFYSTYIPRHYDQAETLIEFYDAYYLWKDGTSPVYDFFRALLQLQTMKGGLTQDIGLLISLLFGPHRLSLWLANFGALMLFLAVLYNYASRAMAKETALITATLALLGPAIYIPHGGLYDLRWDFVGIMMFGCFLLSFWKLINQYSKANMTIVIAFALIAIDVRSINMAYVGLTLFGVTLCFVLLSASKPLRSYALAQFRTMLILGAVVALFYAVFAAIHWADINSYYLDRTLPGRPLSDEKLVRMHESGAEDGILLYYIQYTIKMYKPYLGYPLFALAALWIYQWVPRRQVLRLDVPATSAGFAANEFRRRIEGIVIAVVSSVAVLASSSLYAPNPIIPAYLLGAYSCLLICAAPSAKQTGRKVFPWIILIALFSIAVIRISATQSWNGSELKSQNNVNQMFQSVLANNPEGGRIHFAVVDEAIQSETFAIWLYENGNRKLKEKFSMFQPDILPISPTEYDSALTESDVVFKWNKAPLKSLYPSEEQLKGELGITSWAKRASQFDLLKELPYKDGVIGVYERRVRVAEIQVPFSVEGGSWFWLGEEPARISIVNRAATALPVKVSATLSLGPSVPNGSQVKFCVVSGNRVLSCYPVSSKNFNFEAVVPVDPGKNEVKLAVMHEADLVLLPVPNDSRRLLLNVSNLLMAETGS